MVARASVCIEHILTRAIRKWERPGCREYPTSATHRKAPRRCCIAGALASSPAGFRWAAKDRRPLRAARTIWFPHRRKGPGVVGMRGLPRPGAKGVVITLAGRSEVIRVRPGVRVSPPSSKRELSGTRLSRQPGFHGWFSPNQLRANACIAASLVAAKPCTGSRP